MERHSLFAALTNAAGSLLVDLVGNALQPPESAALTALRTVPVAELDAGMDQAAICRVTGEQPGLIAVAMSQDAARQLTSLVLGDMGEVTPRHIENVVTETSQWIASRVLSALAVTDFNVAPETVAATSLADWFPVDSDTVCLLLDSGLGSIHVTMRLGAESP